MIFRSQLGLFRIFQTPNTDLTLFSLQIQQSIFNSENKTMNKSVRIEQFCRIITPKSNRQIFQNSLHLEKKNKKRQRCIIPKHFQQEQTVNNISFRVNFEESLISIALQFPMNQSRPQQRTLPYSLQFPSPPKSPLKSNYISTTKYNIITFLPFSFLLQFKRYANIYFLISAIMQSIPLISPLTPFSAVAPLVFVISLSMIREGYEDYQRYKSDKESNSRKTLVMEKGEFVERSWGKVKPASIVKVRQDQSFPADLIPLVSHSSSGVVYLQTSSLDGEKNLKPKNCLVYTQLSYNSNPAFAPFLQGHLDCIEPNGHLYQFDGEIQFSGQKKSITMNQKNLLLRGSKLKNVEWVVGLVVYVGEDTKIMRNGGKGETKISNIEKRVNSLILAILVFQLLCCLASSFYCYFACQSNLTFVEFITSNISCVNLSLISFGSYFILNNTMIPISLIVSLQFVKVFQGYFMQKDPDMRSMGNDKPLKCNSVSINQELGQIEYILTDKTGTLTCNQMVFKQLVVGNQTFGSYDDPHLRFRSQSVNSLRKSERESYLKSDQKSHSKMFSFETRGLDHQLHKKPKREGNARTVEELFEDKRKLLDEMLLIMATCHQCIRDPRTHEYQGPSPDQVTLVDAANHIGYEYVSTQNDVITVQLKDHQQNFTLLKVFEFDSDRKRMSVIVRHHGVIKLYTKGADATVIPRLARKQPYLKFLTEKASEMSKNGLRSLMFAMRILPESVLEKPLDSNLENELTLIGLTGIEDKLQDYVPETIASLRYGGIKFVLLTGDKVETAENISRSCGLIQESIILASNQEYKIAETYKILEKNPGLSLVVDGSIVDLQLHKQIMGHIIMESESTIFCRVTPNQKAQIVKIVKQHGKMTLAIGDGANDVNMILEAHVGVGLYGQEGMRAAQVSNYAMGQFCLLWKLLLCHGRLNYIRISEMILYFFYKNMVFTMPQFVFSFYNLGSGQSIYLSWAITLYNLAFTFFPVVIRAVFQVDITVQANKDMLKRQTEDSLHTYYPKMYYIGQKNTIFNNRNFIAWFLLGAVQGTACLLINLYALNGLDCNSGQNSYQNGFYFVQISLVTCIVILVNVKLALNVQNWNCLLIIGFIIPTFGTYFLYVYLSNIWQFSPTMGYTSDLLTMPTFYLTQVISIMGIFTIDLLIYSIKSFQESLQNYIKFTSLRGQRLSEGKINTLDEKIRSTPQRKGSGIQDQDFDQMTEDYAKQHLKLSILRQANQKSSNQSSRMIVPLNSFEIDSPAPHSQL